MKRLIINAIVPGIFFLIGFIFCFAWGQCRIGKLQMYIDPQGNGTLLLGNGHLVGLASDKVNSFDVLFQDSGFRFFFSHSSPELEFETVDFNGDGIPEKVYVKNENKKKIERLIRSIIVEYY